MKKSLFLLAALPLMAGCAHDRMQDRSDTMSHDPYLRAEDRSFDRHAVDQPGANRAVRDADTSTSDPTSDRLYQRDLQDGSVPDDSSRNLNRPADQSEFPSATSDQFDSYPDNYTENGLKGWHRQRWMRTVW